MAFEQDFVYWSLVEQLVVDQNYSILAISQDGNEMVLQPYRKKQYSIIRLRRADVDWGNTLAVDIEQAGRRFEQLVRNGVRGPITVLNIYFSPLAPVDDYPEVFVKGYSGGRKGNIDITSMMIRNDNLEESIEKIQQAMSIQLDVENILSEKEINAEDIQSIRKKVITHQKEMRDAERKLFQNGKPFFTNIFLAIQIVMFLILEFNGGSTNTETLIQYGAKFNPLIYEGEWWRFVSPILLHIGFLHLLMNSFALFYIGPAVERAYGKWKFLFIYLVAGVSGSIVSFAFSPFLSAGASGAIFGCFGALLYLAVYNRKVFFRTMGSNLLIVVGINLALGFVIPNIDNAGHIGGLIGGFLAALVVQLPHQKKLLIRLIGIVGTVVLIFGLFQYGMSQAKEQYPDYIALQGQELIQNEKFEEAYQYLSKSISDNHNSNEVIFLASVAAIQLQKYDEAIDYLERIIKVDDSYHQAHYNLALLYANQQNSDQAIEEVTKALKYDPDNKKYQALKDELTR